ncbi:hypothetical protein Q9233_006712 [Columba guinea]|nr:hypothetical protein Q9233_006712 [Columba guinea]
MAIPYYKALEKKQEGQGTFGFVALTPWRVYHLTSLIILGILILQIIKDLVFSRIKGAQLWRTIIGKMPVTGAHGYSKKLMFWNTVPQQQQLQGLTNKHED